MTEELGVASRVFDTFVGLFVLFVSTCVELKALKGVSLTHNYCLAD